jgi:hypothetical protein
MSGSDIALFNFPRRTAANRSMVGAEQCGQPQFSPNAFSICAITRTASMECRPIEELVLNADRPHSKHGFPNAR